MYDIIIIGAGPAGMTAGIYGRRAEKTVLMLDNTGFGGQIVNTPEVENYPGFSHISGFELASNIYEQATKLGAEMIFEKAVAIEDRGTSKVVRTGQNSYEAKAVILATGAKNRPLGLPREAELTGAGISYCATCDGAFFKGKTVAVIGGGNTALEDAEVLSGLTEKVYLIHRRDSFRGDEKTVKRLSEKENVEMVLDCVPEEFIGENTVSGLRIRNVKTGEIKNLDVQGVFVAVGQMPDNESFADVVELDEKGYVKANESCMTNSAGIFTAGDCRTKKVRQIATAVSDGAEASIGAVEYINQL